MRRSGLLLAFLLLPVLVSSCAAHAYEGVYAEARHYDGPHRASRYHSRVEPDVHRYVERLDAYLHLSRRQEQRIQRLLADRVYRLLDSTRRPEHAYVYPFPRRYDRKPDRRVQRWWYETDRRVEEVLTRRQVRAYRAFTGRDDYRDRRDNRRYRRY